MFLLLAILAATTCAHAGLVTWEPAQNVTRDEDVSTSGTLLSAFSLGVGVGAPTIAVHGVPFTVLVIPQNSATPVSLGGRGFFEYTAPGGGIRNRFLGLSPDYNRLLQNSVIASSAKLTLNGLTSGANYAFEWWSDLLGVTGNSTTAGGAVLNPSVGQFQIGSFTATGASQVIDFSPAPGADGVVVNAFQLRQLATGTVPEPGTAAAGILLLGLCGTLRSRRR